MSKRELIERELDLLQENELDRLLAFVESPKQAHADRTMPALVAESALVKDWMTAEEGCGLGQFVRGDVVVLNFPFSDGCGSFAFEAKVFSINGIAVTRSVPGCANEGDMDAMTGYVGVRRQETAG